MNKDLLPENIHLRDNVVLPLLNEVLRRHDHKADAQTLDAKLFTDLIHQHTERVTAEAVREARIDELNYLIANHDANNSFGYFIEDRIVELNRTEGETDDE